MLRQLGDLTPERVRLVPPPGTATEQDVVDVERRENRLCELVDGTLVEKAVGFYESRLALTLEEFLLPHDLGTLSGGDMLPGFELAVARYFVRVGARRS